MSYHVQIVDDDVLPPAHDWVVGQQGGEGERFGDTIAFIERSAVSDRTVSQCWIAAQQLLNAS